ncbi:MAG: RNA methyltransferase [Candidatus Magnetoovum sp. WYHC-5]|nr:RNA methyltransferase [Candidatus Magnetoovum sp. WYHC-5]
MEGKKIIEDSLLNCDLELVNAFCTSNFISKEVNTPIIEQLFKKGAEIIEVSKEVMEKLSDTKTCQEIAVTAKMKPLHIDRLEKEKLSFVVVCDRIKDPGNLGTIIRCACAFDASAVVILQGTCYPYSPKVIRASAGKVFKIPIVFAGLDDLLHMNIKLIGTTPSGGVSLQSSKIEEPLAIVLGEEASGISSEIKEKIHSLLTIDIKDEAESLNVASAACICFYEINKEKNKNIRGNKILKEN